MATKGNSIIEEHQNLENSWQQITEKLGDVELLAWSTSSRVFYTEDNRILKVQHPALGGMSPAHYPEFEFSIYEKIEGICWQVEPKYYKVDGWQVFEKKMAMGQSVDEMIRSGKWLGPFILLKITYALLRITMRGVFFRQFRGRHIFIDGTDICFIDFGGSSHMSTAKALSKTFFPKKGSTYWAFLNHILRCNLKILLGKKIQNNEPQFYKNFNDHYTKIRLANSRVFNEVEVSKLSEIEKVLLNKVKENELSSEIFDFVIGDYDYFIFGDQDWPMVWTKFLYNTKKNTSDSIIDNGSGLGIVALTAALSGYEKVTYINYRGDIYIDWLNLICDKLNLKEKITIINSQDVEDLSPDILIDVNHLLEDKLSLKASLLTLTRNKSLDQNAKFNWKHGGSFYSLNQESH